MEELSQQGEETGKSTRSEREILEELLTLARRQDRAVSNVSSNEVVFGTPRTAIINPQDMSPSVFNARIKSIVAALGEEKIEFSMFAEGGGLRLRIEEDFKHATPEKQASGLKFLHNAELLARLLNIAIAVENGPFGNEAFPPF